jgi:hypothetical protein
MKWLVAVLLASSSAMAQQPDPATMQRALNVLKMQREQMADAAAQEMIKNVVLAEENAKLKAEIEDLKKASPK